MPTSLGIDWKSVFSMGGQLAGWASFLWLAGKDTKKAIWTPRLKINFQGQRDLRVWHFRDTGWQRKFANLHINHRGKDTARRCVAVMRILRRPESDTSIEETMSLHWAGVDYSALSTGAEPVEIGSEGRRLDVAFTDRDQRVQGCWAAVPFALSGDLQRNQAYLYPGEYIVEVEVSCENGRGDKKYFRITSPRSWEDLDINLLS